jgi:hypothetical protein
VSTEIIGLTQSIAYAERLAAEARLHGPDGNESYLVQLAAARVTGASLTTGHDMQAAFAAAAAAAAAHAAELGKQSTVQERYNANPDAGDKGYLTGDAAGGEGRRAQLPQQDAARPAPPVPFGDGDTRQASWNADHARSDYGSLTLVDDQDGAVTVRVSRDEMEDMLTQLRWLTEYGSGSADWMDCASGARLSWGEWEETDDGARVLNLYASDNTGDHFATLRLSADDLVQLHHRLLQHVREPAEAAR